MIGLSDKQIKAGYKCFCMVENGFALLFSVEKCDCGSDIMASNSIKIRFTSGKRSITRVRLLWLGLIESSIINNEGYSTEDGSGICCDECC